MVEKKREILTGQSRPCTPEQKVNEWEEQKVESVDHGVTLAWSEMGGEGRGSRRNSRENVRKQKGLVLARAGQGELNSQASALSPRTGADVIWTRCGRILYGLGERDAHGHDLGIASPRTESRSTSCSVPRNRGASEKEPEQHEQTQMCFHLAGPPRPNDVTPAKLCNMLAGGA